MRLHYNEGEAVGFPPFRRAHEEHPVIPDCTRANMLVFEKYVRLLNVSGATVALNNAFCCFCCCCNCLCNMISPSSEISRISVFLEGSVVNNSCISTFIKGGAKK